MRSLLYITLTALLIVSVVSAQDEQPMAVSGGTARTAALGGNPTNPYIMDYSDVFINPAYAAKYSDLLFSDVGYSFTQYSAAGQYVGYTLGLGDLALGISIGHREGPMFAETAYGTGTFGSSDYMVAALNTYLAGGGFGAAAQEPRVPIQLFGAYKLGTLTVGFGFYMSSWSLEDQNGGLVGASQSIEISNSQTGFKGGVLFELNRNFIVDGSVLFRFNSSLGDFIDVTVPATPTGGKYDVSGTEFAVNGRVFLGLTRQITVVPQVRFSTFGYQPEISVTPAIPGLNTKPNDYARSEFEVGVGINTTLETGMVTVGISMQRIGLTNDVTTGPPGGPFTTTKNSRTWFDLPKINMGGEFYLLSWMTGRFGYFKRLSSRTTKTEPPAPGLSSELSLDQEPGYAPSLGFTTVDQQLALGLGLKINRFALDGYMGERFIAAGPYILSGNFQDMFGVLSLSYKF